MASGHWVRQARQATAASSRSGMHPRCDGRDFHWQVTADVATPRATKSTVPSIGWTIVFRNSDDLHYAYTREAL